MSNQAGRNDPCPCGSGKKYKKCCMADSRIVVEDSGWQKIRETEGKLVTTKLRPWVMSLGRGIVAHAWDTFWFGEDNTWPESMVESTANQLFEAWLLFDWKPAFPKGMEHTGLEEGFPPALQFLQKRGYTLTEYEKEFIKEISHTHYSFYVVTEAIPEKSLTLQDIFLKSVVTVKEKQGSTTIKPGDIVFARVLSMDNQSICVGMMPIIIPSHFHIELLEVRDSLTEEYGALDEKKLAGEAAESMREILFEFLEDVMNPASPMVCNTDGDPIAPHTVYFSIDCMPEEACKKLLPMTLDKKADDYLANSKKNKKTGEITKIKMPWLKRGNKKHDHWENTLLGDIVIERNKITVSVNSEKRAAKAKAAVLKRLGDKVCFLRQKKANMAKVMKREAVSGAMV